MEKAIKTHPDATVMITFASFRSVYDTVIEALHFPQLKVIAIIAEGVPENQTRKIIRVRLYKKIHHLPYQDFNYLQFKSNG